MVSVANPLPGGELAAFAAPSKREAFTAPRILCS
jgi:hypothetical protein